MEQEECQRTIQACSSAASRYCDGSFNPMAADETGLHNANATLSEPSPGIMLCRGLEMHIMYGEGSL